jgi:hypothetical protein
MSKNIRLAFLYFFILATFTGCGGSESKQKIDFTSKELTGAVSSHLSVAENWGRWTDGTPFTLTFNKELPESFIVNIKTVHIFGSNIGKDFRVSVGNQSQTFKGDIKPQIITLDFKDIPKGTNMVSIDIPYPNSNAGERSLGIGLEYLEIVPIK